MSTLIIIPARKNSKGLPGKNTRLLGNKPLIAYTIEFARQVVEANDTVCITTDDDEVIKVANQYGLSIPFKRPESLSNDNASTYDVIIHAMDHYKKQGFIFEDVLLLQPTSPFRTIVDYQSMKFEFQSNTEIDMIVSVKRSKENPYFTLFEENENGFLQKSKKVNAERRQDVPDVYAYNGSIYLIRSKSLRQSRIGDFTRVIKFVMPDERSIDIDSKYDWVLAEYIMSNLSVSQQ